MPRSLPSEELLTRLQSRDDAAATALFDRYAQRLVALARKRISPALARRIDADDIVQSAYRSFFLKAREGEFVWNRAGDLWRLLVQITLHKLHRQAARHAVQKRSLKREAGPPLSAGHPDLEPQPVEVIALLEQMQVAQNRLTADQRQALQQRLQGDSEVEIAHALGRSPRTVRRLLHQAREILEREFLSEEPIEPPATADKSATALQDFDPRAPLPYEDFLLEDHLGSGGMGKVYRAVQRSLERPVAIKALMKSRLADPRAIERFLQEGKLLARLRHRNIVGIHGIGRFPGGGYFLVLDFVDGKSLAELIAKQPLPIDHSVRIITEVAEAIAYAHSQGVLHGDLTPGNVLLDVNSQVQVTDFGFGQLLQEAHDSEGKLLAGGGTRGYLAPEQLDPEAKLDERTDVYGLAAVWYATLTGQPPIDPRLDLPSISKASIRPPSAWNPTVSEAIDRLCLYALERSPQDRPADAMAFAEELRKCDEGP